MNKIRTSLWMVAPVVLLSSCTVIESTNYVPAVATTDYVSNIGYYGTSPYWGNGYYSGHAYSTWYGDYYGPSVYVSDWSF
ncbi:Uncharacterised protein [Legionella beliardensis]|uniref:Lipoprotein n=1 Tax=Legionella beliardensis TaxID=91822 RepID=A0A378I3Y4_9GAMM|nr:hypothetical protein [Legionella beliardensis]STX29425.1 Uncharacterised protein [Legionella beliardensis]